MTFEEWWADARARNLVPMWDSNKHSAQLAWNASRQWLQREDAAKEMLRLADLWDGNVDKGVAQ